MAKFLLVTIPAALAAVLAGVSARADEGTGSGVRGLVTRAPAPMTIDGRLDEWSSAFVTPVHYNHGKLDDRAAQFSAMWDDSAFYIGLRALDRHRANPGQAPALWNGDAVEYYLDTRPGSALRGKDWSEGAIHFYFTAFDGQELRPRWVMRRGIATSDLELKGVEIAATAYEWGYELEFKLPWSNFPGFTPREGAFLAADAELCSGDGAARTDRTFAYGSPLSVQQPASQAKLQLVAAFDPAFLPMVGPSLFPMWVETPWVQPERAKVQAVVGIAPAMIDAVGRVDVRIHDTDGTVLESVPAAIESFGPSGKGFARAVAKWSIDRHAPGTFVATARVTSKDGKVLATVAPRLVQEAQMSGR